MDGLYLTKEKTLVVRTGTPESHQLGDIEVNVKVLGVGLSPSDLSIIEKFPNLLGEQASHLLGFELCGEVTQVGKAVSTFKPGDQVIGFLPINQGACTGMVRLPFFDLVLAPSLPVLELAASIGPAVVALTALQFLANWKRGNSLLVVGSSPDAVMTAQLAVLWGLRTWVLAGQAAHFSRVSVERLADATWSSVATATNQLGFDTIIDFAASDISSLFPLLGPFGRLATTSETLQLDPPLWRLLVQRGLSLSALEPAVWSAGTQQGRLQHILSEVANLLGSGRLLTLQKLGVGVNHFSLGNAASALPGLQENQAKAVVLF